jgi:hypothetical protein
MHFGWNDMGFELCEGKRFSSSPNCPDLLWETPGFLFNGQWGSLPRLMLTIHLHLAPKFGMSRATPPVPLRCLHGVNMDNFTLLRVTCTLNLVALILNLPQKYITSLVCYLCAATFRIPVYSNQIFQHF